MRYEINKRLILETEIELEVEDTKEVEPEDDTLNKLGKAGATLAAIGATGTAYAINKNKVDAKVKKVKDNAKAAINKKASETTTKVKNKVKNTTQNVLLKASRAFKKKK